MKQQERSRLLCYLLVAQLIARAKSGDWMRTDHLVESTHMWMTSNQLTCDWIERSRLMYASRELADSVIGSSLRTDIASLAWLFADRWQLNFEREEVRLLHAMCVEYLARRPIGV